MTAMGCRAATAGAHHPAGQRRRDERPGSGTGVAVGSGVGDGLAVGSASASALGVAVAVGVLLAWAIWRRVRAVPWAGERVRD